MQNKLLFVFHPAVVSNLHHRSYVERHEGGNEHSFLFWQCFLQTQRRLLLTKSKNHSGQSGAKLKRAL